MGPHLTDWLCAWVNGRSPVHPALFATGDTDGNVCLWNMNDSMEVR